MLVELLVGMAAIVIIAVILFLWSRNCGKRRAGQSASHAGLLPLPPLYLNNALRQIPSRFESEMQYVSILYYIFFAF